jgi:hypothetical protein
MACLLRTSTWEEQCSAPYIAVMLPVTRVRYSTPATSLHGQAQYTRLITAGTVNSDSNVTPGTLHAARPPPERQYMTPAMSLEKQSIMATMSIEGQPCHSTDSKPRLLHHSPCETDNQHPPHHPLRGTIPFTGRNLGVTHTDLQLGV